MAYARMMSAGIVGIPFVVAPAAAIVGRRDPDKRVNGDVDPLPGAGNEPEDGP